MGTTKVVESLLLPDVTATQFFYCARFCDGSRAVAAGGSGTNALHVLRRLSHEVGLKIKDRSSFLSMMTRKLGRSRVDAKSCKPWQRTRAAFDLHLGVWDETLV